MFFDMLFEISLVCVSLGAMVALEWSLPGVLPHVPLQITSCSVSVVALVTFERLFSCMLYHCVNCEL